MSKKFSIVVPVYNCASVIEACFISLINQKNEGTKNDYEIIFVNDGSTDKSLEVLNMLAKKNDKVRVFDRPHIGACAARNYGLKQAKGDYIIYVDSDDEVSANLLESLSCPINKHKNLDMIIYKYQKEDEPNAEYGFDIEPGFYNKQNIATKITEPHFMKGMLNNKIVLNSCNVCYRRDYLLKHYCQDETIVYGEDWAYSYECLYFAESAHFLDKSLYLYKNTNSQSVMNTQRNEIKKLNDFCKLMLYIGNRFAFSEKQINTRFAQCCLYGISKILNSAWGNNTLQFSKEAKKLPASKKALPQKLLKIISNTNLKPKDKIYTKYLLTIFV